MSEPREFWVHKEVAILCENRIINIHDRIYFENLIPKNAYDELLNDARALRDALEVECGDQGLRGSLEVLENFNSKYGLKKDGGT